jgi:hypothetical protein
MKSKYSNAQKEAVGMRVVEQIIREPWDCKWQEYDARNDNAVDGICIMRRRGIETGGIVFIQVKCGGDGYRKDFAKYPNHIGVNLGAKYIDEHTPRWRRVPGPMVVVFVDDNIDKRNPPAWWANLNDPATFSPTSKGVLLIPKSQRFGPHSKGDFLALCGNRPADYQLPTINTVKEDSLIPSASTSLHKCAREFYTLWSKANPTLHPSLGTVLINREGWRHITRLGRAPERRIQSFTLLGAAKRMIEELDYFDLLGRVEKHEMPDGTTRLVDYLGIRANVTFPHRQATVIQVVLKRRRLIPKDRPTGQSQKIWFWSVYELRRGTQ